MFINLKEKVIIIYAVILSSLFKIYFCIITYLYSCIVFALSYVATGEVVKGLSGLCRLSTAIFQTNHLQI